MSELPIMHSYFDQSLKISLEAPEGWDIIRSDEHPLGLFAPEEDNYRAHLNFKVDKLVPPTVEKFDELVHDAYYTDQLGLNQYKLIESYKLEIDERPAFAARFDWLLEQVDIPLSQIDVMALATADSFYLMHGISLRQLGEKYIPIFEHVIGSIRFIPARLE